MMFLVKLAKPDRFLQQLLCWFRFEMNAPNLSSQWKTCEKQMSGFEFTETVVNG